ncbi:MAG: hypothetical protein C4303_06335 [candidate division GAL15 bacterium]
MRFVFRDRHGAGRRGTGLPRVPRHGAAAVLPQDRLRPLHADHHLSAVRGRGCGAGQPLHPVRRGGVHLPPDRLDGLVGHQPGDGEGEAGQHGGPRGDLYVVVHLSRHPVFQRKGLDLYADLKVSMVQAALGDEVEIPTLEGPERFSLPAGVQPGEVLTLRGRGMPDLRGRRGDLQLRVRVEVPRHLTPEQRRLLVELARTMGLHVKPQRRKFSDRVRDLLS